MDSNCYEDKLRKLSEELEKDTPRNKKIKSLMRATFDGRRQWVLQDAPGVSEVLQVFPPLKKSSRVSHPCFHVQNNYCYTLLYKCEMCINIHLSTLKFLVLVHVFFLSDHSYYCFYSCFSFGLN